MRKDRPGSFIHKQETTGKILKKASCNTSVQQVYGNEQFYARLFDKKLKASKILFWHGFVTTDAG